MDLFEKCAGFTEAREIMALGIYPYFQAVDPYRATVAKFEDKELGDKYLKHECHQFLCNRKDKNKIKTRDQRQMVDVDGQKNGYAH